MPVDMYFKLMTLLKERAARHCQEISHGFLSLSYNSLFQKGRKLSLFSQ
jgi:hypothetical protein